MFEVEWIKIRVDIFSDEKILMIGSMPDGDKILLMWFKLLCLAGKMNNHGAFIINGKIPMKIEDFSEIFHEKKSKVKKAFEIFSSFDMVENINGVLTITNWTKHQNLDEIERKKAYQREYMRKRRKAQAEESDESKAPCKANSKTNSKANSKANVSRPEVRSKNKNILYNDDDINLKDRGNGKTECENVVVVDGFTGKAVSDYTNRINPESPAFVLRAIAEYERELSPDVCIAAFDIALAEKKTGWFYIRGILNKWKSRGVKCLADVAEAEDAFQERKGAENAPEPKKLKAKRIIDENGNETWKVIDS